ncbi:TrkA C-terminal domain-containing protein [Fictibacillus nanhaiensis]|uniref:TrkA C-terminal domain-containing protein n=1 Tax=Fictibacillus nanhaiensis TaxID=742169 RepID=UPI002E219C72|nr:TrkA C-terminal domain-containing protein [Fictibacillus nanhaiensis]MED1862060.1 TrkA C-terminal domain-containing protein [Fictibacillus nanhaiensis]
MGFLFTLLYFAIIGIVIEINVLLFTLTGLKKEIARFQVISMFTATGFTTGESELILEHPVRRRLSTFLILFGVFSLAVIISSISNILSDEFRSIELGIIILVLISLYVILSVPKLKQYMKRTFESHMEKNYNLADLPLRDVMYFEEDDVVVELPIHKDSKIMGKQLKDIIEEDDDLIVLFIKRGDVTVRKDSYTTKIQEGDMLVLYGHKSCLQERFKNEMKELKTKEEVEVYK